MKNVMRKLSMQHYYLTLVAVLFTMFGAGVMAAGTLAGQIVGTVCLIAAVVLFIVRIGVKRKFKVEFEKSLTGIVTSSLKESNILYNGFKVKSKGQGLKYVIKVYDYLGAYAEQELARRVHGLVQDSQMKVKVKINQSNVHEMVADIFS